MQSVPGEYRGGGDDLFANVLDDLGSWQHGIHAHFAAALLGLWLGVGACVSGRWQPAQAVKDAGPGLFPAQEPAGLSSSGCLAACPRALSAMRTPKAHLGSREVAGGEVVASPSRPTSLLTRPGLSASLAVAGSVRSRSRGRFPSRLSTNQTCWLLVDTRVSLMIRGSVSERSRLHLSSSHASGLRL